MSATRRGFCWVATLAISLAPTVLLAQVDILSGRKLTTLGSAPPAERPESLVAVKANLVPDGSGRGAMLEVTATITPPWYTYSTTQRSGAASPTVLALDNSSDYRLVGDWRPNLPPSLHTDGGDAYETFEGQVTWQAPIEIRRGVALKDVQVNGTARIQVCRKGACLQPTQFAFNAVEAADEVPRADAAKATGTFKHPGIHALLRGQLEPQGLAPGSTATLVITAEPEPGWHIYELAARDPDAIGYKPTLIVLTNTSGFKAQPTQSSGRAVTAPADVPGAPPQRYYEGSVTWSTTIEVPKNARPGNYPIEGLIGYQTCTTSACDLPRGARFSATLVVGAPGKAAAPLAFVEAKYAEAAKAAAARPIETAKPSVRTSGLATLPMIVIASLIGGFLLNFMPCVLPVIGLKILSFADQAGKSRSHVLALNLWYSLGTLTVLMVLATLATAVAWGFSDKNLGWGEQFSSTWFNVVMVAIVFTMALSFLGVWEIPIPGFVGSGAAAEIAAQEGAGGAFFKGVLTTILATPCSGPFLGPVFGFTLNQPPAVTYLIFACIGLGMSSPYLVIGAFPRLIRFLPKPGAWMDTFKQMMGFVLLGTIVFLFSFMNRDYIVPTFAMMVGLWAACWWIGRTSPVEPLSKTLAAWAQGAVFASVVTVAAFTYLVPQQSIIPWKNFSQAELARLNNEGHTVLVDFTADWCLTCKVNLKTAIETQDVRKAIEENKVVPLLADWTDGSAEIKDMLGKLESASIPVLAVFPADRSKPPIVHRDLVTKQQVLDAIQAAGPSNTGGKALAIAVPSGG